MIEQLQEFRWPASICTSHQDRTGQVHCRRRQANGARRPRALQRGRRAGDRRLAESGARNASGGKSLMFAFEGGYHGRTLGASRSPPATAIAAVSAISATEHSSSPSPTPSAAPKGMTAEEYAESIVARTSVASSKTNTTRSGTPRPTSANTQPSTSSPFRAPVAT